MIIEIKIHQNEKDSDKKGKCFERLIRRVIESHRYKISSNVNFTGMEIDLIANHLDRDGETLYVECKAKAKVTSTEIRNFAFNVSHKKASFGYFIRTQELEHQAAGLVSEMKADPRYSNLTFFDPERVLSILEDGNWIKRLEVAKEKITKKYLIIAEHGDYFVLLASTGLGSLGYHYYAVNAKTGKEIDDAGHLRDIVEGIPECEGLVKLPLPNNAPTELPGIPPLITIEAISEVQSSENWYDYLPASSEHFVGRVELRTNILRHGCPVITKTNSIG